MSQNWSVGPMLAACCGDSINVWGFAGEGPGPSSIHEETLSNSSGSSSAGGTSTGLLSVRWSPNRKAVVFGGASGRVHTLAGGQIFNTSMPPFEGGISSLRFSDDGKQLFIANQAFVHVLDLKHQEVQARLSDHSAAITSFCIDAKDGFLASASSDGVIMLRSLKQQQQQQQQQQQVVQLWQQDGCSKLSLSLVAHSDHVLVAAASGSSTCLMRLSQELQQEVLPSHSGNVSGVALCGEHTLFSCGDDGHARVWDLRSRQAAMRSSKLAVPLTCLSVKEDDLRLAVGAADGSVHLVDLRMPVQQMLAGSFRSPGPVTDLHWQPPTKAAGGGGAVAAALAALHAGGEVLAASMAAMQVAEAPRQRLQPGREQPLAAKEQGILALRDSTNHLPDAAGRAKSKPVEPDVKLAVPAAAAGAGVASGASPTGVKGAVGSKASFGVREGVPSLGPPSAASSGAKAASLRLGGGSEAAGERAGGKAAAAAAAEVGGSSDAVRLVVERAVAAVREDVRDLHVELLRQTHMQQVWRAALREGERKMDLNQMLGRVLANQERMQAELGALSANVEQMVRRQKASALSLF